LLLTNQLHHQNRQQHHYPPLNLDDTVNLENSPLSATGTDDPTSTVQPPPTAADGDIPSEIAEESDEEPKNTLEQDVSDELLAEQRTIDPTQFNGSAVEGAENWLRHFNNYCAYKAYDDAKRLGLFKVLLAGEPQHGLTPYQRQLCAIGMHCEKLSYSII